MALAADVIMDYPHMDSEKAVMAFSNGLGEPEGNVQHAVVKEKEAPLRALMPHCLRSLTVLVICMPKATC